MLNVAEVIGDVLAEHAEACALAQEDVGEETLTCEAVDPSEVNLLAVSASDGLMDFLTAEDASHVFAASFFVENNPHPFVAAEFLILTAAQRWDEAYNREYRDDIAVAAFKIFSDDSILAESAKSAES